VAPGAVVWKASRESVEDEVEAELELVGEVLGGLQVVGRLSQFGTPSTSCQQSAARVRPKASDDGCSCRSDCIPHQNYDI
jgi:hypothetical protein